MKILVIAQISNSLIFLRKTTDTAFKVHIYSFIKLYENSNENNFFI